MKGLSSVIRVAAVLTGSGAAFACQTGHRPPRGAAETRVPPAATAPSPEQGPPRSPKVAAPSSTAATLLGVCKTARESPKPRGNPHEDLDSILWQQTAAEYRANTTTVYRAAALALSGLVAANQSGKEPVVVFDLDETVLDNSRFQGRLLAEKRLYDSDLWDCWVGQKQALLVPGAELLFRALVEQRVRGRFITNRKCLPRDGEDCPQERETLENLNALLKDTGYVATPDELFLSAERIPSSSAIWADEKKPRRDFVSETYAIIMLVGDDLGDFLEGVRKATIATRAGELTKVDDRWDQSWFVLPNPSYGSWVTAVDQEAAADPKRTRPVVVEAFGYPHE